jgi:hypothetical protein
MKRLRKNWDIYDVDWQAEYQKWNYILGNDAEGYRYAVHNVVDETETLYYDEDSAWRWLYDRLIETLYDVDYLPTLEELEWK